MRIEALLQEPTVVGFMILLLLNIVLIGMFVWIVCIRIKNRKILNSAVRSKITGIDAAKQVIKDAGIKGFKLSPDTYYGFDFANKKLFIPEKYYDSNTLEAIVMSTIAASEAMHHTFGGDTVKRSFERHVQLRKFLKEHNVFVFGWLLVGIVLVITGEPFYLAIFSMPVIWLTYLFVVTLLVDMGTFRWAIKAIRGSDFLTDKEKTAATNDLLYTKILYMMLYAIFITSGLFILSQWLVPYASMLYQKLFMA